MLTKAMLMEYFDDLVTEREIHLQDVQAYVANRRGDERFLGRYLRNWPKNSAIVVISHLCLCQPGHRNGVRGV